MSIYGQRTKRLREPSLYDIAGPNYKRRMDNSYLAVQQANQYKAMNRGGGRQSPSFKLYVPRTPGGQTISERKYFDSEVLASPIANSYANWANSWQNPTALGTLFAPTQGNDISNREARSCYVYNITIKGSLTLQPQSGGTVGEPGENVRLVLVLDKQTNGQAMTGDQLLSSGTGPPMFFAYQSTANFGRFQVLKDKTYSFANTPLTTATTIILNGVTKQFKLKYVFKEPLKINFNSTNSGTITDIIDNSFHLFGGTENDEHTIQLNYKSRVSFKG